MKKKNYCIDCLKQGIKTEISPQSKRCLKCAGKISAKKQKGRKLTKEWIEKMSGKNAHGYIDGRCSKIYYCIICGEVICYQTWFRGSKLCRKCAGILHSKKMKLKYKNEQHPNLKHGNANCIVCGKEIKYGCKRCKKHWDEFNSGKNHSNFGKITTTHFWKKYKRINMRSSWEILFAQFLDCSGIRWNYEPKTFDLGNTTYTPDFYISEWNCYIEIKGYVSDIFKKKLPLFKKRYSKVNIKVLMKPELQKIGILN